MKQLISQHQKQISNSFIGIFLLALLIIFSLVIASLNNITFALILLGGIFFLLVLLLKPIIIPQIALFSVIFFRYQFEIGGISINIFRIMMILTIVSMFFINLRLNKGNIQQIAKQILIGVSFLSLAFIAWLRAPESFRQIATSNFLIIGFWWVAFISFFILMHDIKFFERLLTVYVGSSTILAIFGIYQYILWKIFGQLPILPLNQFVTSDKISFIAGVGTIRIESLLHDANLLAIYLVVGIVVLWRKLHFSRTSLKKSILTSMIVIHSIAILLTFSRSGLAMLIFIFIFMLMKNMRAKNNFYLLGVITLLLSAIIFINISTSAISDSIIVRFSTPEEHRSALAKIGTDLFLSSPIYGVGWGDPTLLQESKTGLADTTHSFYLTIMVHYGIAGMIVLGIWLWPILVYIISSLFRRTKSISVYIFAVTLLPLLAFQLIYDDLFGEVMVAPWVILYSWVIWHSKRARRDEYQPRYKIMGKISSAV